MLNFDNMSINQGAPHIDIFPTYVQFITFNGILDVNFHVHCYILRTCLLCMGVLQCAWWEQIIHGCSPMECRHNPFVFIDGIFHMTIDFLPGFIGILELYFKKTLQVFSCTKEPSLRSHHVPYIKLSGPIVSL